MSLNVQAHEIFLSQLLAPTSSINHKHQNIVEYTRQIFMIFVDHARQEEIINHETLKRKYTYIMCVSQ